MTSIILQTATRVLMPLLMLFALFLLWRGHNHPGGGFVSGLVVASSFVLYAIAFGVDAARRAVLVRPSALLGIGLLVALASGVPGILAGEPFMTAQWMELGRISLGTPLAFDVGVFLAVIGVVLTIVFTLAEVALNED